MIFDLHTHSIWSDGNLTPAELVQQARSRGYGGIGITDHADASNLELILDHLKEFQRSISRGWKDIHVITGVELTHCPPKQIPALIRTAREKQASIVAVHGETPVEPVPPGTNEAALRAGADLLAHPGLLSEKDASLAEKSRTFIEITCRKGHCLSNGHVAKMVRRHGLPYVFNSDAHTPSDLYSADHLRKVALGAGMTRAELTKGQRIAARFIAERIRKCAG